MIRRRCKRLLSGDVSLKAGVSEGNSRGAEMGGSDARIKSVLGKKKKRNRRMPVQGDRKKTSVVMKDANRPLCN